MAKSTVTQNDQSAQTSFWQKFFPAKKSNSENKKKKSDQKDGIRETIESVAIAFILAFLFRSFEAEAFVIPTGSMAPTLYGQHKDVDCEQCGFHFAVGASDEMDGENNYYMGERSRLEGAYCPNCRFHNNIYDLHNFKGDRILVNKFPYEFTEPNRWDVVVFKYPEQPHKNYIKRLVGLPGETLSIKQGDLYRKTDGAWEMLRKQDPNKQRGLQISVYDNNHPATALLKAGWPERWAAVEPGTGADSLAGWQETNNGWQPNSDNRAFTISANDQSADQLNWLRYRHLLPNDDVWDAVNFDNPQQSHLPPPIPKLISDFCGYNEYTGGSPLGRPHHDQYLYWVGDLTLSFNLQLDEIKESSILLLELNEGARQYRCRINPIDGMATLSHTVAISRDSQEEKILGEPQATPITASGSYTIQFANVDDRLCLWVDGRLIDFGSAAEYQPLGGLQLQAPWEEDLIPVGIATRNVSARVSNLLLERDIYYRSDQLRDSEANQPAHHLGHVDEYTSSKAELRSLLHDPEAWFNLYQENLSSDLDLNAEMLFEYPLDADEYMMLGDNSPRSADSRLWPNLRRARHRYAVPRSALVGKAFFIYWPHGVPFMNDGKGYTLFNHKEITEIQDNGDGYAIRATKTSEYPKYSFPFYPNVGRMRRIR